MPIPKIKHTNESYFSRTNHEIQLKIMNCTKNLSQVQL